MSHALPHESAAAAVPRPEAVDASSHRPDPVRRYATVTFMRGALVAVGVTLAAGFLAALYSIPALAPAMQGLGLDLRQLRPIHTVFAGAWIFLGGAAVVHRFLQDHGGITTSGDRWRLRVQVLAWAAAGFGIFISMLFHVTSGREYIGFRPVFSVLILVGWICYLWNFYRVTGRTFWRQPVYVTMWGVAFLFFLYTFVEQHAYLLPAVFGDPVHDLRVQWKATGTLVGSFNLFVYGSLIYIGERISGNTSYGHSRTAYALFAVGLLNSFTNFGHHTYHLPQSALVNWISFVVSMTEIIILARVVTEVWQMVRAREEQPFPAACTTLTVTKWWTLAMLFTSVIISVPPLNAVIHGTYVVTGHAMGTTIGIDTMALLASLFYILGEFARGRPGARAARLDSLATRRTVVRLNLAVAALVLWLHVSGLVTGLSRMKFAPGETYVPPGWLAASNGMVFAVTGGAAVVFFSLVLRTLLPAAFREV